MLFPEFNKCAPNELLLEPCSKFKVEPVEPSPDLYQSLRERMEEIEDDDEDDDDGDIVVRR